MDYDSLLKLVGDDPVFESSMLMAGDVNPNLIRQQLTRWVKAGKILQLRRSVYAIAPPYQKTKPHPFLVANRLQKASYVSLQSALSYYDLIPEVVYSTTSVSTGRPERLDTPLGVYTYQHLKTDLLFGYQSINIGAQNALVATPEKALLDLIYFQAGSDSYDYLNELRLQNTEQINIQKLVTFSEKFNLQKLINATEIIRQLISEENNLYEDL